MQDAKLQYNERSWAIDVISHINSFLPKANLSIKRASGENTLKTGKSLFFPDVLLYSDRSSGRVIQGWELKMPDTPIDNFELIDNARKKARALGLNSFVVWNVKEAILYIREKDTEEYYPQKEPLYTNSLIKTREDVQRKPDLWQNATFDILSKIDRFLKGGKISEISPEAIFSGDGIIDELLSCHAEIKHYIDQSCKKDNKVDSKVQIWWRHVKDEYPGETFPASPLAYHVLLRWFNRFIFSNILKAYTSEAQKVSNINQDTSIQEALDIFTDVSNTSNFSNIFSEDDFDYLIPTEAWNTLVTFNAFLSDFDFAKIDKNVLQAVLKSSVLSTIKKVAGLYITPDHLANLLVRLTLSNKSGVVIDPFCGTGTIVNAILSIKADYNITGTDAIKQTWGCDKFAFPVQIATIAISTPETMGETLRIFTHDSFELFTGKLVKLTDPSSGNKLNFKIPKFSAIISNLPFVRFEEISKFNSSAKIKIDNFYSKYDIQKNERLDGRSDLFAYIPFMLYEILEDDGYVGFIISNSWLSDAGWGKRFRNLLRRFYWIEYVVTSGCGRWFKNADVVANLLICKKKKPASSSNETSFISTHSSLDDCDMEDIKNIANDILATCPDNVTITSISDSELDKLNELNIGWNACFSKIRWFLSNVNVFKSIEEYVVVARGERRGWNELFYPSETEQPKIEPEFLKPVIRNLRKVASLCVLPQEKAFCCPNNMDKLKLGNKNGAIQWIKRFENTRNEKGVPLPEVLGRANLLWYQMDPTTLADFVISMNPDTRIFVPKTNEPTFVDQRLIRFSIKDYAKKDLLHALLNSIYTLFLIEAVGFGRGLGVLDINTTKIKKGLYVPSLELISDENSKIIREAFNNLKLRPVKPILDELEDSSRKEFDLCVTKAIGLSEGDMKQAYDGLKTLYRIRKSVNQ